jgi:hypothetical protein
MGPNKIEKQFKEQLNAREIKPSGMAWDKLDAMLIAADKKPKRNFRWFYVAASFIGFLIIGTVFFNGFETVKINIGVPIVLEQKAAVNNLKEPEIINVDVLPSQIQKKTIKVYIVADNKNLKKQPQQLENNKEEVLIINQVKEDGAIVISSKNMNYQSTSENKYISAEQILAEVSGTKFESKTSNETIRKTRKAISVNPNDLLLNAETELSQSFRESALDRFNKKFNTIKTVLVNRNYEE